MASAVPQPTGCSLMLDHIGHAGYGYVWDNAKRTQVRAHRVVWEHHNGPIPDGLHVLHSCDQPACVAIGHLSLGTHRQNMGERSERGRVARAAAKVAEDDVRAIRADTRSTTAIGRDYGLHPSQVSRIKRRVYWAHVE